MQYKIPIQIENEDTIVLGLSLRQLIIIMVWGAVAYTLFQYLEPKTGGVVAGVIAVPIAVLGFIIAIIKVAEMTFLPMFLNTLRLTLNGQSRPWSQGTDSYSELSIGYLASSTPQGMNAKQNESFTQAIQNSDGFSEKLKNL